MRTDPFIRALAMHTGLDFGWPLSLPPVDAHEGRRYHSSPFGGSLNRNQGLFPQELIGDHA